jgi:uncharacterized protein (DUF2141 family)
MMGHRIKEDDMSAEQTIREQAEAHRVARECVATLRDIADALTFLGMPAGRTMNFLLTDLADGIKTMDMAYSGSLHEQFRQSEEATRNMMRAVFAVSGVDIDGIKD